MFFALWPEADVRAPLDSLARGCAAQAGGRAPDAANLHLTLAFIGEVSASRITTLREIGGKATAAAPAFVLTLDRIGAFHKQGIVWVGPSSANGAIEALAGELSLLLKAAEFDLESRPFHPHVTLARRARTRNLDSTGGGPLRAPIVWNVQRVTLAASEHARGALRYVSIGSWPLDGGATQ